MGLFYSKVVTKKENTETPIMKSNLKPRIEIELKPKITNEFESQLISPTTENQSPLNSPLKPAIQQHIKSPLKSKLIPRLESIDGSSVSI